MTPEAIRNLTNARDAATARPPSKNSSPSRDGSPPDQSPYINHAELLYDERGLPSITAPFTSR